MSQTIYQESVQRSPDICSNCLAVRQDRLERRPYKTSHRSDTDEYGGGSTGGISDITIPRPDQTNSEAGAARECHNPPRACDCGVFSAFYTRRDETYVDSAGDEHAFVLSKERATEYATNLSATLRHLGYEHSRTDLLDVVETLKSDPDWAGRDDDIFARATHEAVVNPTPNTDVAVTAD